MPEHIAHGEYGQLFILGAPHKKPVVVAEAKDILQPILARWHANLGELAAELMAVYYSGEERCGTATIATFGYQVSNLFVTRGFSDTTQAIASEAMDLAWKRTPKGHYAIRILLAEKRLDGAYARDYQALASAMKLAEDGMGELGWRRLDHIFTLLWFAAFFATVERGASGPTHTRRTAR